ncbi:MAG: nicotinate phosphoribosyltransferase [Bacteroidales bacterium]|nr:nicotinate phosphoribosyltransferase [Bacteroidales bacterium]
MKVAPVIENIILLTDSYKVSHHRLYPPGMTGMYSYLESRGGRYAELVFFGLQYLLKRYLTGPVLRREQITEAEAFFAEHFGSHHVFDTHRWMRLLEKHGGRLPVSIRAVPEGTVITPGNVLITIENTDPEFPWLTNYLESLLVQVWYPITVASRGRAMKRTIHHALVRSGTPAAIDFKLHDFGFRGVSSVETASLGGAAHLVHFQGSDTLVGIRLLQKYYHAAMPGYSIPASEHSTLTAWGADHECEAMRNLLDAFPTGMVACVSDSYDVFRACRDYWGGTLRDRVQHRDGTLVIRPDSGDAAEILPQLLAILAERFGTTDNAQGYRVLPSQVRLIQGDGIAEETVGPILEAVMAAGWSADNLVFGSGGGLLQKMDRDTCRFAFKCSAAVVDGRLIAVYKDPVTDPGKRSKRGWLKLIRGDDGGFETVAESDPRPDELVEVFRNGSLLVDQHFSAIRQRATVETGTG